MTHDRRPRVPFPAMPPVHYASPTQPWEDPLYIPGTPMRAPANGAIPMPGKVPTQGSPPAGQSVFISDPWHRATLVSGVVNPAIVTAPDTQPFLVAPNTARNLLVMRNASTGGQNIYVEFGKVATTDTVIFLVPGQMILIDAVVPGDDLYAACDVAGGRLVFGYSTINLP